MFILNLNYTIESGILLNCRGAKNLAYDSKRISASKIDGAVAQGLEQSAHNRLVAGSNPASPTINHPKHLSDNKLQFKKHDRQWTKTAKYN
jgi:hypothetical protein